MTLTCQKKYQKSDCDKMTAVNLNNSFKEAESVFPKICIFEIRQQTTNREIYV